MGEPESRAWVLEKLQAALCITDDALIRLIDVLPTVANQMQLSDADVATTVWLLSQAGWYLQEGEPDDQV